MALKFPFSNPFRSVCDAFRSYAPITFTTPPTPKKDGMVESKVRAPILEARLPSKHSVIAQSEADKKFVAVFEKDEARIRAAAIRKTNGYETINGRKVLLGDRLSVSDYHTAEIYITADGLNVVKIYSEDMNQLFLKEIILTDYLIQKQLPVIPIIERDLNRRIIVKPYYEGNVGEVRMLGLDNNGVYYSPTVELFNEIKSEQHRLNTILMSLNGSVDLSRFVTSHPLSSNGQLCNLRDAVRPINQRIVPKEGLLHLYVMDP